MHFPRRPQLREEVLGHDDEEYDALHTETIYRGIAIDTQPVARREHSTGDRYVGSATQRNRSGVVSF